MSAKGLLQMRSSSSPTRKACSSGATNVSLNRILLLAIAAAFAIASTIRAADALDEDAQFLATVLANTEDTWNRIFQQSGRIYREPTLVLFTGSTSSACGFASAASGPFYCPGDQKIYIDPAYLRSNFATIGDFAQAYVLAILVGNHVQNLLGMLHKVDAARRQTSQAEANELAVRLDLHAHCLAGIWGHAANEEGILEPGDIDEALNAATRIGDLQRERFGSALPLPYGTAQERERWFKLGFEQGSIDACDTFAITSP